VRTVVWVAVGVLALNLLLVGALVCIGVTRRVQIARTHRELERLGLLVKWPYAPKNRPIWPRWAAGFAGCVALIITTFTVTAAGPSATTQISAAGSSPHSEPFHAAVGRPKIDMGSERPVTPYPRPASQGAASPLDPTSSSAPPATDAGNDAGAPSAVAAVPASASTIRLDWAPVDQATRYDIERSTDTVAWTPVASTSGAHTAYTDDALASGTTYYYRVVAFVDGQEASRSDAVSATTAVDASTPPMFISATGSATSIELQWSDLEGTLGFLIERSPDGVAWTQIGTAGQGVTSYTDTGLPPATSYSYRIIAETSDGESPPSKVLSASTDAFGPSTSSANDAPS
jgi:hypothetical protein